MSDDIMDMLTSVQTTGTIASSTGKGDASVGTITNNTGKDADSKRTMLECMAPTKKFRDDEEHVMYYEFLHTNPESKPSKPKK